MTTDLIAQAEAVMEGVTPGDWRAVDTVIHIGITGDTYADGRPRWGGMDVRHMPDAQANARFIAWCRAGVPALIACIRELEGRLEEAVQAATKHAQMADDYQEERDQARRRRDAWKAKAEGYDELAAAVRAKIKAEPATMSRVLLKAALIESERARIAAEAKLAEVEKERDAFHQEMVYRGGRLLAAEATVATLTAQVEAMRGALKQIKAVKAVNDSAANIRMIWEMAKIARAALTTENQTNG